MCQKQAVARQRQPIRAAADLQGSCGRRLFVRAVLPGFTALAQRPAQATIGLQSAPGMADPDIDFPVGAVHLYQLIEARDDLRPRIESFAQPVLVITSNGTK
jgi:hypothetical protein